MTPADRSVEAFLEEVAGGGVTPGGGATAAVAGAAGAALLEMVCANTLDRDVAGDEREDLAACRRSVADNRAQLLSLAAADVAAVEAVVEAAGTTDGDDRQAAIQTARLRATEVPVEIAESCRDGLERAPIVVEAGNPNAVADGVVGVNLLYAALKSMVYTAEVNLATVADAGAAEGLEERATAAARAGEAAFERTMAALPD